MKLKLIVASLAIFMAVGVAAAQNQKTETKSTAKKTCFVDENKNNICDKHENGSCTVGNGKGLNDGSGRGQGVRDGSGRANGKGQAVKNGQGRKGGKGASHRGRGNTPNNKVGKGNNQGKGLQDGTGRGNGGRGARFVDKNENGTCDYREKSN